jgi:Arc/MetJ family transcription regulator
MSRTVIDLDVEALAGAAELFGTKTTKDTVNTALRDAVRRKRRTEAFDRLAEMAAEGDFDDLLDKRSYRP